MAVTALLESFKPYYKWNTFNTVEILDADPKDIFISFKPYYKWNTFNTSGLIPFLFKSASVLNLIINGIPSILQLKLYLLF